MLQESKESQRIRDVYEKRKINCYSQLYTAFNSGNFFIIQRRDYEIINILKRYGISSLTEKKILDLGCGTGGELRNLIRYGARPENLYGIDVLPDRIESAKTLSPNIEFECRNALQLPYADESFDIVMQFTVFTSILDFETKKRVAGEMIRVLRPRGVILWYDFFMGNPKNHDVKGVKKKEIDELFPLCNIAMKRITLAPPIVRLIAPYSWFICYLLEKLKILNTHYIGIIRKISVN